MRNVRQCDIDVVPHVKGESGSPHLILAPIAWGQGVESGSFSLRALAEVGGSTGVGKQIQFRTRGRDAPSFSLSIFHCSQQCNFATANGCVGDFTHSVWDFGIGSRVISSFFQIALFAIPPARLGLESGHFPSFTVSVNRLCRLPLFPGEPKTAQ